MMTGIDKEDSRVCHILQPNRDLAVNWAVDVAQQIDQYLAELYATDGYTSLNFAEAALLIQGSIQIYSRKVEYLYCLVLHALEFIAQKRQDQQGTDAIQADGNNADVVGDEEGEEFLNLDDIQEEVHIDIDNEVHGTSGLSTAARPPVSLIVLEGDCVEIAGDPGELASYQIALSTLYRDFLLLEPCDADAVDKYLNVIETGAKETLCCPDTVTCCKTPRSLFSTPSKKAQSARKSGLSKGCQSAIKVPGLNGVGYSQDAAKNLEGAVDDTWKEPCCPDFNDEENNYFNEGFLGGHLGSEEEFEDDPWKSLNPHESGDLYVKPFKKGQLVRKQKGRYDKQNGLESEFSLARIKDSCLESVEAQGYNRQEKQVCQSCSTYEKLRCSFILKQNDSCDAVDDDKIDDENYGIQDEFHDSGTYDLFVRPSNSSYIDVPVHPAEDHRHSNFVQNNGFANFEKRLDGGESFEDLCCSHLDVLLRSISESEKQTEVATRVSIWKQKIEKNLEEQDSHPPFDIHLYGERVLDKLSSSLGEGVKNESRGLKSFAEIVDGQERHEVARTFTALLQLVNNGNVTLEKFISDSQSFCFTSDKSFFVKLLSSKRRHQEMLGYKAPPMGAVSSSKRSMERIITYHSGVKTAVKEREEKDLSSDVAPDSGWLTPGKLSSSLGKDNGEHKLHNLVKLGSDYEHRYSGNSIRKLPAIQCTPENKRKRRCESFKPIEVQMAG